MLSLRLASRAALARPMTRLLSTAEKNLCRVLKEELEFEKQQEGAQAVDEYTGTNVPSDLKSLLQKTGFSLQSTPGDQETVLVKKVGLETIKVAFNVSAPQSALDEMEEEMEDLEAAEEDMEPVDVTIDIAKQSKDGSDLGTMTFFAAADYNNEFYVTQVEFTADSQLASDRSAQAELDRRVKYMGPVYEDLDDTLQEQFAQYLESRGMTPELCEFIHGFSEWKEQNEYMRWLGAVQKFVESE